MTLSIKMSGKIRLSLAVAAFTLLCGCASVDFDYPKPETHGFDDTSQTYLGRQIEPVVAARPDGYSGFDPIGDGIDALAARLLMAARAERS